MICKGMFYDVKITRNTQRIFHPQNRKFYLQCFRYIRCAIYWARVGLFFVVNYATTPHLTVIHHLNGIFP